MIDQAGAHMLYGYYVARPYVDFYTTPRRIFSCVAPLRKM